ncbi:hypothetical protein BC831DRAFT_460042 [Entophlyctis helioformis]|nr:hypothetical protein BC831DRAFT_460042 [Entophlyctis helioformis]
MATASDRVRSLYRQLLQDNELVARQTLTFHAKQKWIDELLPPSSAPGGLASILGDSVFPVFVESEGLLYLKTIRGGPDGRDLLLALSHSAGRAHARSLSQGGDAAAAASAAASNWPFVAHLRPFLLDMTKQFEPERPVSAQRMADLPAYGSAAATSAQPAASASAPTADSVSKAPARETRIAKIKTDKPAAPSGSDPAALPPKAPAAVKTLSAESKAKAIELHRVPIVMCALCLFGTEERMAPGSDLGLVVREFHHELSRWLDRHGGPRFGAFPKSRLFAFFSELGSPKLLIRGEVWTLSETRVPNANDRDVFLDKMDSPTDADREAAITIADVWADFAEDYFTIKDDDEAGTSDSDMDSDGSGDDDLEYEMDQLAPTAGSRKSRDRAASTATADATKTAPWVDVRELEYVVDLQIFYADVTRIGGHPDRTQFLAKVQAILDKNYKDVCVYLFGSSVNNLGTNSSDVDMTIEVVRGDLSSHPVRNMHHLANSLRRAGMVDVVAISNARVPICKFVDRQFGVTADINVGHYLGVFNSALLKTYTMLDPRIKPFIMLIKMWAKSRDINNPSSGGTLSSYAYTLMAIAFLQRVGILPSLQAIGAASGPPNIISVPVPTRRLGKRKAIPMRQIDVTYERDFNHPILKRVAGTGIAIGENINNVWRSRKGVAALFFEFMRFFGYEFSYEEGLRVSVRDGGIVSVDSNGHVTMLPGGLGIDGNVLSATTALPTHEASASAAGYVANPASDGLVLANVDMGSAEPATAPKDKSKTAATSAPVAGKAKGKSKRTLFVEDPFEIDHNTARTLTRIPLFIAECRRAVELIISGRTHAVRDLFAPCTQQQQPRESSKKQMQRRHKMQVVRTFMTRAKMRLAYLVEHGGVGTRSEGGSPVPGDQTEEPVDGQGGARGETGESRGKGRKGRKRSDVHDNGLVSAPVVLQFEDLAII